MNIDKIRELQSITFEINADLEKWNIVIGKTLHHTRLHFSIIINDTVIKVLSKYLIESLNYSGTYICVFRQNKIDDKKFLVKFNLNTKTKTILIIKLKKDIEKSYIFNKNKNFYFDNHVYFYNFIERATEIINQIKHARLPIKNKIVNKNGLKIVKKCKV